ncbi:MAG: hypothetical protein VX740_01990 [Pseudomonadota bacterium]|jgi:hypothetical protein|nr:hypothetical protein [Alphaproteobacteria bacterium]MEC7702482.1 hypothetical protein [Pseudomonadota bacterium]MEC9235772.1 hypothetical protein [Pseudomonadota bacterium]MED5422188.1 hypothetical protein [Pseudomonadota bacterium]|tara:strand:- start:3412 stop:3558 length:147 start_codon:yes stop_codon:yes gene_type:complete
MSGISPISPIPRINIKPVKPSPRDEERDEHADKSKNPPKDKKPNGPKP